MRTLPMFPLSAVLLPHESIPLFVFEPRYRAMVAECMSEDRCFGVVLIERGSEVGGGDERTGHGALATIDGVRQLDDGRLLLLVTGRERIEVLGWLEDDPYPNAMVELAQPAESIDLGERIGTLTERVRYARGLWSELYEQPLRSDENTAVEAAHDEERVWRLCSLTPLAEFDRYRLLRAENAAARLDVLEGLLAELCNELELFRDQGSN